MGQEIENRKANIERADDADDEIVDALSMLLVVAASKDEWFVELAF